MSRKVAREVAMKMVFERLFDSNDDTYMEVLDKSGIEAEPTDDDVAFASDIVAGIEAHDDELTEKISELAIGWSVGRMPKVDFSIMKVAVYEIMFREDIPDRVSINEAVELAKRFCGDKSPSYINGMLGTLVKKLAGQE